MRTRQLSNYKTIKHIIINKKTRLMREDANGPCRVVSLCSARPKSNAVHQYISSTFGMVVPASIMSVLCAHQTGPDLVATVAIENPEHAALSSPKEQRSFAASTDPKSPHHRSPLSPPQASAYPPTVWFHAWGGVVGPPMLTSATATSPPTNSLFQPCSL